MSPKVIGKKKGWAKKPPADNAVEKSSWSHTRDAVVSVTISPSGKSALSGSVVQFALTGWRSDSTPPLSAGRAWMATGGTIDLGGLYKAGNTPSESSRKLATHATSPLCGHRNGDCYLRAPVNPAQPVVHFAADRHEGQTGTVTDGSTAVLAGGDNLNEWCPY